MNPDSRCPRLPHLMASVLAGLAILAAGCGISPPRTAEQSDADYLHARLRSDGDALRWAVEYYDLVQRMDASEMSREWLKRPPGRDSEALQTMQRAILHARASPDPARALPLLESVLALQTPEAVALHPFARLLSEHLAERQRLAAISERLTRQLERTGQELKETRHQNERLKEKLDALTEIERSLPARPPATPLPTMPDRRN